MPPDPLEQQLDDFDPPRRAAALAALVERARRDPIPLPPAGSWINIHAHTFFSYNAYGYSPSRFAWLARQRGLAAAGIVDFDVLDGLEEFIAAARLLGLKSVVSLESRVFVPEFATRGINSPGEPGIAYHMGVGFVTSRLARPAATFLDDLRQSAATRTRELLDRVNAYLQPVTLDYDRDVRPLTPRGNATERHLCTAYERRALQVFPDPAPRAAWWRAKLGDAPPDSAPLQNLIRAKTMKRGGVGYVQPGAGSFPLLAAMNQFSLAAGAIPTLCWLDGTSAGELAIDELLDTAAATGNAALTIIPDRNYTPGVNDRKLQNLYDIVALAERRHLPIFGGTEMNSPGNKFVDAFDTPELAPLLPVFLRGAHLAYAHSLLQRAAGLGYLSDWAKSSFPDVAAKNAFYEQLGRQLAPDREARLAHLSATATPAQILRLAAP